MSVPKLRFPGFVGEWEEKPLGEIATFQRGFDLPSKDRREGNIPIVSSGGISGFHDEAKVNGPGIVTGRYGSIGDLFYLKKPHWPLNTALWVKDFHGNSMDFAFYHLSRVDFAKLSDKTGVPGINRNDLHRLKASTTTLPEQKKIAAFLGAVDAKLAALAAKQAALGRFKAGLMQKLFSQQLRFTRDDGTAFPEWQEKRLGEVFTWVKTNSLSREFLTHDGGEVQNIHYGDIHTKFRPLFRQAAEKVPFVGTNSALKPFTDEEYCRVGDVVIADASEDYADIGKAIEIVEVRERSLVAGLHTYIARPKIGTLVVGFSGYLLRSAPMRRQIMRIAQGISVLGVSKGNLEELTFWIPHPDEQQKIAAALTALDTKIQAVAEQATKLQTFKKGLLQQMFV